MLGKAVSMVAWLFFLLYPSKMIGYMSNCTRDYIGGEKMCFENWMK